MSVFAEYKEILLHGIAETIFMTFVPLFFSYLIGLPLGVLLTITAKKGIAPAPQFNAVFGAIINILRSMPFMVLMIFAIPFTRAVIGTSIGANAANIPLILAATPFVARMVEQSLCEVDIGMIEAARCMGASNFQIVTRVMLVESVPSLMRGLAVSTITILGYTAVTGAVGAGGLGNIAYRYGYQRYRKEVMYATIVLLVAIVCIIQAVFSLLAGKLDKRNR